jgi:hypothetical protein
MQDKEVGQNIDHIDGLELAGDTDRQAFMSELVAARTAGVNQVTIDFELHQFRHQFGKTSCLSFVRSELNASRLLGHLAVVSLKQLSLCAEPIIQRGAAPTRLMYLESEFRNFSLGDHVAHEERGNLRARVT